MRRTRFQASRKLTCATRSSAMYDERPELSKDEWISALKLSTKWFFNDLRKLAISHLSSIWMDAIDRICLAKEYQVYDWLLKGYEQVVERLVTPKRTFTWRLNFVTKPKHTLTAHEGQKIGMEVALELSGIAIQRLTCPVAGDVRSDVLKWCWKEFERIRRDEQRFMTRTERREEEARELASQAEDERLEEEVRVKAEAARMEDDGRVQAEAERLQEEARTKRETGQVEEKASMTAEVVNEANQKSGNEEKAKLKQGEDEKTVELAAVSLGPLKNDVEDVQEATAGPSEGEKARQPEDENARLKQKIIERLKEEKRAEKRERRKKQAEKEEKRLQDLAEKELKRVKGLPEWEVAEKVVPSDAT